ncbi:membrane protein insertion efficiency factor YidD [bacterium]|nr:membrane protein insertion efficiency factor YidD [bacterium]
MAFAGLVLIRSYQITLSRLMPNQCRFEPHCSKYGFEAVRAHGFFRGSALTVFRVVRCQPFCRAGHDPVPPRSPSPSSVSHARRAEEEK